MRSIRAFSFGLLVVFAFTGSSNTVFGGPVRKGGEVVSLNALRSEKIWTALSANETNERLIEVAAQVPGGIYSDLEAAGVFATAIYYRYNDLENRWVGRTNWTFSRTFEVTSSFRSKEKQVLVFEGLDTISKVYINDQLVGSSENMFVRYIFDVKNAIQAGENTIRVEFMSPVEYARKEWDKQSADYPVLPIGLPAEYQGEDHANHIRKMQASFSWDWGPAYPSSGIWKNVYLQAFDDAVIRDVITYLLPNKELPDETPDTYWNVVAKAYLDQSASIQDDLYVTVMMTLENDILAFESKKFDPSLPSQDVTLRVEGNTVRLWWPNGYGSQPLYKTQVILHTPNGNEVSSYTFLSGFRTVALNEDQIDPLNPNLGNEFFVKVNGIPIFSKGSNSIPLHVLPEKVTPELTEWFFESAKATHMNMVRIWGGGIYESDLFFDMADQTGVMIWEDFMFACSMYPATESFLKNVRDEVETQVKRLQYHAGLAVWATNNENEAALRNDWYGTSRDAELYTRDYIKLYIDTIKAYAEELDITRPVLPSSPTNGRHSEEEGWIATDPYDKRYGDVHYYDFDLDSWDWRSFPRTRYASEYGYQSWPSPETFELSTSVDEDWYFDSPMMGYRQHHPKGQSEILHLIQQNLPYPANPNGTEAFVTILQLNRISQAMSVKTETESYRRLKGELNTTTGEGRTMGALYWQLNDIWPGASWASIEYNGRWKLLHYYARNFFAPLLASPYLLDGDVQVDIVSDLPTPVTVNKLTVSVFSLDSFTPVVRKEVGPITLSPLGVNYKAATIIASELGKCSNPLDTICFVTTTMDVGPDNFIFLQPPKDASLLPSPSFVFFNWSHNPDTKLIRFEIATDSIALFVTLNIRDLDVVGAFSENGFHMTSNSKFVEFSYKSPSYIDLQWFIQNLEIQSLYELSRGI